jgi:hypothetical protein
MNLREGNSWAGFSKHFKLVSNSKESNKKIKIVQGSVKFLKELDNYRRITESTDKNVLTFKKISIS